MTRVCRINLRSIRLLGTLFMYDSSSTFLLRVRYQLGLNSTLEQAMVGDGLGDDIVSTVIVKRDKRQLTVSAYGGQSDHMKIEIPGKDDRLDLTGFMYVGGYPNPSTQHPSFHRVNFKGCMFQAIFKGNREVNFIDGAINRDSKFDQKYIQVTDNPVIPPRAINFNKDSYVRFVIQFADPINQGQILQKFYGSFEFRTVLFKGTIFTASSVSLKFQRSQLSLISGGDIVSINFPNEGQANDGRWFRVQYVVENTNLELHLNGVRQKIKPSNNPQYGSEITFGFFDNKRNFIGCIRNLVVQFLPISYYDLVDPYRETNLADGLNDLSDGCKASDPCIPNPCFHDAVCRTVVHDPGVECDCLQRYKEPLCQFCKYACFCLHLCS